MFLRGQGISAAPSECCLHLHFNLHVHLHLLLLLQGKAVCGGRQLHNWRFYSGCYTPSISLHTQMSLTPFPLKHQHFDPERVGDVGIGKVALPWLSRCWEVVNRPPGVVWSGQPELVRLVLA